MPIYTSEVDQGVVQLVKRLRKRYKGLRKRFKTKNILCIKTTGHLSDKKVAVVTPIKFPYSELPGGSDYYYILEVNGVVWESLHRTVRALLIFHELLHIPEGGCDPTSKAHRKTTPHDTQDFLTVLAIAGSTSVEKLNWCRPDAKIPDILKTDIPKLPSMMMTLEEEAEGERKKKKKKRKKK